MYKKTLDKNARFFKSYGHMIVYYLLNYSGAYLYMALGIDYRHYKDAKWTDHWKKKMIEMIDEAFPLSSLEKITALNTLDECEKDIVQKYENP